ncbi:MAG: IS21-like element helper ATPase IstB [Labilithrix sp.]|nr:IS21-like element helper ATPase IstB [Labilithrix sp.]
MIIEETIQKMLELKMHGMAKATRELLESAPTQQLPFEDKLGLIVDREWSERDNRRVSRRIKEARLTTQASLDAVDCDSARGLEKTVIKQLMTCQWAKSKQNVLVTGATGTGKSFLGAALAESACRHGLRALFVRVPRLVEDLAVARASGSYSSALARLSRIDVLVLDDFLLAPMKDAERRDLLEVLEDRYERAATVITSQMSSKTWHAALGDPTIADAICDRLVHNAYEIALRGPSMRKKKASAQNH